jgi:hypothetical protein
VSIEGLGGSDVYTRDGRRILRWEVYEDAPRAWSVSRVAPLVVGGEFGRCRYT